MYMRPTQWGLYFLEGCLTTVTVYTLQQLIIFGKKASLGDKAQESAKYALLPTRSIGFMIVTPVFLPRSSVPSLISLNHHTSHDYHYVLP